MHALPGKMIHSHFSLKKKQDGELSLDTGRYSIMQTCDGGKLSLPIS